MRSAYLLGLVLLCFAAAALAQTQPAALFPRDDENIAAGIKIVKGILVSVKAFVEDIFGNRELWLHIDQRALCVATSVVKQAVALHIHSAIGNCSLVSHSCDLFVGEYVSSAQLFGHPFLKDQFVEACRQNAELVEIFGDMQAALPHFYRTADILAHMLALAATSSTRISLKEAEHVAQDWSVPYPSTNFFCQSDARMRDRIAQSARDVRDQKDLILTYLNDYLLGLDGRPTTKLTIPTCYTAYIYATNSIVYFIYKLFDFNLLLEMGPCSTCPGFETYKDYQAGGCQQNKKQASTC